MSGAPDADDVRSAVPIPDLTPIDDALRSGAAELKAAVKQFRPADLGRDLSRRPIAEGRAILDAIDDRRGAAMLRAAHPVVAAQLLGALEAPRTCHLLQFIPTDHEVAILGELPPDRRAVPVGAVRAVQILQQHLAPGPAQAGMLARDARPGHDDIALRRPANHHTLAGELVFFAAGVGQIGG